MRTSNTQKIGDILKDFIRESHIEDKLTKVTLINSWEKVVGKTMARYTKKLYIKDGVLFVYLSSSVARNELLLLRSGLIKALNDRAGKEMVKEIVVR